MRSITFLVVFVLSLFFSCEKNILSASLDNKVPDPIYITSWEGLKFFFEENCDYTNHDLQGGIILNIDSISIGGSITEKIFDYKIWLTQKKGIPDYGEFYEIATVFGKDRQVEIGPDLKLPCSFYNQYNSKANINIYVGDSIYGFWENAPIQVQWDFKKNEKLKEIKEINFYL